MKLITIIFTLLLSINLNADLVINAYNEYRAGNHLTALNLYKKECYKGSSTACASVGAMYLDGIGKERDIEKAKRFLHMSCKSGNKYGCEIIKKISKQEQMKKKRLVSTASQQNFQKWKKAGFNTKDTKFYLSKNISLSEAKKWKKAYFSTKNAYYYIKKNISVSEAILRIKKKH